MATASEKDVEIRHDHAQHDHGVDWPILDESAEVTGFEADETNLPKGYFYSRFFIGSFAAIGLGLWAGTGAL